MICNLCGTELPGVKKYCGNQKLKGSCAAKRHNEWMKNRYLGKPKVIKGKGYLDYFKEEMLKTKSPEEVDRLVYNQRQILYRNASSLGV